MYFMYVIVKANFCIFPYVSFLPTCRKGYFTKEVTMALNIPGLVVMAVFYLLILGTGIWASMRSKKEERKCTGDGMEITLLAGRNINLLVGVFTLTGAVLPALANQQQ